MKFLNWMLHPKSIMHETYVWNAIAMMANSFQTMLLLIILTNFGTPEDSSIFVMGYAVANLLVNLGKYGVRQFQVTDAKTEYNFSSYRIQRYFTVVIMLCVCILYSAYEYMTGNYTLYKSSIIFIICLLKVIDAFEDVFHGELQKKGRLDIASKILGLRNIIYIVEFGVLYLITRNLMVTVLVCFFSSLVITAILNWIPSEYYVKDKCNSDEIKKIFKYCGPLCFTTFINMYVTNAPKYIIDQNVSDEVQTCFNIIFMSVFVIGLLGNFILQPVLKKMGDIWNDKSIRTFEKLIFKIMAAMAAISVVTVFIGSLVGIPILQLIYNVDLQAYHSELILFMICGCLIAVLNLFIMVITTMRKQMLLVYGYTAVALLFFISGEKIVVSYGLIGLCQLFLLGILLLNIYQLILIVTLIKKRENIEEDSDDC